MLHYPDEIEYSAKYPDETYDYRHVLLSKPVAKEVWKLTGGAKRLLTETKWRGVGVQQSRGWVHYEFHAREPHILLFRRPLVQKSVQEEAAPPAAEETKPEEAAKEEPAKKAAPEKAPMEEIAPSPAAEEAMPEQASKEKPAKEAAPEGFLKASWRR